MCVTAYKVQERLEVTIYFHTQNISNTKIYLNVFSLIKKRTYFALFASISVNIISKKVQILAILVINDLISLYLYVTKLRLK